MVIWIIDFELVVSFLLYKFFEITGELDEGAIGKFF